MMSTSLQATGLKKYIPILGWLPAPDGLFSLSLRIYWPEQAILDGKWEPSAIKKA